MSAAVRLDDCCARSVSLALRTGLLQRCECGAEFVPPLPAVNNTPGYTPVTLARPLHVVGWNPRLPERKSTPREKKSCTACEAGTGRTLSAMIADLRFIAEWQRCASPRAIDPTPKTPGSGSSREHSELDEALRYSHGRHLERHMRAILEHSDTTTMRAFAWLTPRAPQLSLGHATLPEDLARALASPDQVATWWPAPPPKLSTLPVLPPEPAPGETVEEQMTYAARATEHKLKVSEREARARAIRVATDRYKRARDAGFMGGRIWGTNLLDKLVRLWSSDWGALDCDG